MEREVKRDERGYKPIDSEEKYQYWAQPHYKVEKREKYPVDRRLRYQSREEPIPNLLTSPLPREIMTHPRLKSFKCPILTSYDGTGDKKNYILNF